MITHAYWTAGGLICSVSQSLHASRRLYRVTPLLQARFCIGNQMSKGALGSLLSSLDRASTLTLKEIEIEMEIERERERGRIGMPSTSSLIRSTTTFLLNSNIPGNEREAISILIDKWWTLVYAGSKSSQNSINYATEKSLFSTCGKWKWVYQL